MRAFQIFMLCMLFVNPLIAQQRMTKMTKAMKTYEAGEYTSAIDLFKEAYERSKEKEEKTYLVFLIAECYRKTDNPADAEMWYKKAISRGYKDPVAIIYHAEALKMLERYEEAMAEYQRYSELVPADSKGQEGVETCQKALQWKANPNGYIVENMKFLNSKWYDYSPAYASSDYSTIYFTSCREGSTGTEINKITGQSYSDIYTSSMDRKGSWSEPVPLGEEINTEFDDGNPNIDHSFETMYYTNCKMAKNKAFGCQILISNNQGDTWSKAEPVQISEDSVTIGQPAISPDGLTLYFVSDMSGGLGCKDIWKITRESAGGEWSTPVNMGEQINTERDEMFPYVHQDGALYFSSNGWPGMGGFDIFKAKFNTNNTWTVENMRYPINSASDDIGIVFESEREKGYLSSNRNPKGDFDIYSFTLPPLKFNILGVVKDEKDDKILTGVTVRSISSDGTTQEINSDSEGKFKFMLRPGTDYIIVTSKEGYLNGKDRETTKGLSSSKDLKTIIYMASIKEPIKLENIFWDFNSWQLRPEAMVELNKLVETLNDNPNITIELGSHTDSRGSDDFNRDLSQKRAQSVVNYLIEKGIASDRMVAKGYGESMPSKLDKKTVEKAGMFTEGTALTEQYINTLTTPEQQEMAHFLNRRTEFKVLRTDYIGGRK